MERGGVRVRVCGRVAHTVSDKRSVSVGKEFRFVTLLLNATHLFSAKKATAKNSQERLARERNRLSGVMGTK